VHINSGIPNKAFYLAATALGGNGLGGARARIWYAALTGPGDQPPTATSPPSPGLTVRTRRPATYGADSPEAGRRHGDAWS
jgi:hypothetical protein